MAGIVGWVRRASDRIRVFSWLCGVAALTHIQLTAIQFLLQHNGIQDNLSGFIDACTARTDDKNPDASFDLTLLGLRAMTITIVTSPSAMQEAFALPFRQQFELPSALLDGLGVNPFFHRSFALNSESRKDRQAFKMGLDNAAQRLEVAITTRFASLVAQEQMWQEADIVSVIRNFVFIILGEVFLGIEASSLMREYAEMTHLLDRFDRMWQNPEQMNPVLMMRILMRLEQISDRLHDSRSAAEIPDYYEQKYARRLNVTALFFVSANLVRAITFAVILGSHEAGRQRVNTDSDSLINEILTTIFTDARLFRADTGFFGSSADTGLFQRLRSRLVGGVQSVTPSVAGRPLSGRELIVIPTGHLNHRRLQGPQSMPVPEPALFGVGPRRCPGSPSVRHFMRTVLRCMDEQSLRFTIEQGNDALNDFLAHNHESSGGRAKLVPKVVGHWESLNVGPALVV